MSPHLGHQARLRTPPTVPHVQHHQTKPNHNHSTSTPSLASHRPSTTCTERTSEQFPATNAATITMGRGGAPFSIPAPGEWKGGKGVRGRVVARTLPDPQNPYIIPSRRMGRPDPSGPQTNPDPHPDKSRNGRASPPRRGPSNPFPGTAMSHTTGSPPSSGGGEG